MKKHQIILIVNIIFLLTSSLSGQSIWNGPIIEFEKNNNADPTNKINQDSITGSVAITRGNNGEIYNAYMENQAEKGVSPLGTEWAVGNLSEIETLTFSSFRTAVVIPKFSVGQKLVLHIIEEDIYLSVEFSSWTQGRSGGGFKYKRSTNATTSIVENNSETQISLFPNPSINFIQVTGLNQTENYEIYDVTGSKIIQGSIANNQKIDITNLKKGFYLIKFENGTTERFSKK
ncbi:MAG: hypothetical protein CMP63_01565 [Flavobacteriales bacterium]|nr:hypothetical protein [Flavobacteriales bacterium]|tara:strand:- start:1480 stop:2175 length:696 start_codon:yes stop_codon:yes gene_type:complete